MKMTIDLIHLDDWCFMYIDGDLMYHHHDGLSGNAWEVLEPILDARFGIVTRHWTPFNQIAHNTISDWTRWSKGQHPPKLFKDCSPYITEGFGGYY